MSENYDVTFRPKDPNVISVNSLKRQLTDKQLSKYDDIIVLTGKKYRPIINEVFTNASSIQYPLLGTKGIGEMQRLLKESIRNTVPLHKY